MEIDAVMDEFPTGDVVILRQVLQHLSNSDILKILTKIEGRFSYLLFTDHQPLETLWQPNLDKKSGPDIRVQYGSGLNLEAEPFLLKSKNTKLIDEVKTEEGYIRTYLIELSSST